MKLIPQEFFAEIKLRMARIRKMMKEMDVEAVLIGGNANLYYSTGRFFRGYMYLSLVEDPVWFVVKPQVFEAADYFHNIRKPEDIPAILTKRNYSIPASIALEENDLSYSDIIRLKALFPQAQLANGSIIMKRARMVKTPWEIEEMKIDGRHHTKVYAEVKDCYQPGMTDLRLQIEIEKRLRLEGSLGVSRVSGNLMEINLGSVVGGDNADNPAPYEFTMGGAGVHPALPVGANDSEILEGQTVMIDMNGAFNGYQTDMTRVWSRGEIPELARKAHDCSLEILHTLEEKAVPGLPVKEMYFIALQIVEKYNFKEYFMGHNSQVGFIGHGVGIELNELPVLTAKSKDILEENMTLAIEPKFVIPHVGAVGVENTYVVKDNGLQNITVFPEEIQKF